MCVWGGAVCQAKVSSSFSSSGLSDTDLKQLYENKEGVHWRPRVAGAGNTDVFKGKGKVERSWNPGVEEECWGS